MSRNLNPDQIAALIEEEYSDVDTDDPLDDPDFLSLSDTDSSSEETESEEETDNNPISRLDTFAPLQPQPANQVQPITVNQVRDSKKLHNFSPRHTVSSERCCQIISDLGHSSSPLDCFMMQLPYGLCVWISQYTNQRLQIYEREKKKKITMTNLHEIMSLLGGLCVMGFNRLPSINCYWSGKPSMGNTLLNSTFSRDRFKLLLSKLYMNKPEKPSSAGNFNAIQTTIPGFFV